MVKLIYFVAVAIPVFVADQVTKYLIDTHLTLFSKITVIPGFFNIVKAYNTGAAFSLFANRHSFAVTLIFHALTAIAVIFVIYLFIVTKPNMHLQLIALNLILGGAFANLYDRIRLGHVVDFLDFYIGPYHWPAFNVADASIVIGTGLLLIALIREEKKNSKGGSNF